jgi:hypothetical protein
MGLLEVSNEMAFVRDADTRHDFLDAEECRLGKFFSPLHSERPEVASGRCARFRSEDVAKPGGREVDRLGELAERHRSVKVSFEKLGNPLDSVIHSREGTRHSSVPAGRKTRFIHQTSSALPVSRPSNVSLLLRQREHRSSDRTPKARPINTSVIVSRNTRKRTSPRSAPSAMRMPISLVLLVTECAMTPYRPTFAS